METFPRYWPFVRGIHRSPVNSPHKGQWRGALMFSLFCTRINGWVNNGGAGDLRRYRAHYDVNVMIICNFRMSWQTHYCLQTFHQTWRGRRDISIIVRGINKWKLYRNFLISAWIASLYSLMFKYRQRFRCQEPTEARSQPQAKLF